MKPFRIPVALRWADFDPNFHLRHSVYYDFGAMARVEFLNAAGVTSAFMEEHRIGPVLFREEALFRREVRPGDELFVDVKISRLRANGTRFSMRHELSRADGTCCAVMNVDGAWIDMQRRKLAEPPQEVIDALTQGPRTEDFEWQ
ncbi:MAG: thioesterase family protein [Lewinellaceae bacterium]|nr:thioesterase family protein [Lewinellaceae bacterium]MCB9354433.1 thioesterase family protein [Lewinellaceae bacterium]